jgi:Carboxypeptidase regulatory-like domain
MNVGVDRLLRDVALVGLLAVAAGGSLACGGDGTPSASPVATVASTAVPATSGRLVGVVLAGPTCPVERADKPCPPRPVDAAIEVTNPAGGVVASTRTNAAGRYHITLPAGPYTVVASTGAGLPMCQPVTATVAPGRRTRADITCDTGIR